MLQFGTGFWAVNWSWWMIRDGWICDMYCVLLVAEDLVDSVFFGL